MKRIYLLLIFCFLAIQAFPQQVLIDRGLNVNGLWCFPLYTDTLTYLYLPSEARLALDEEKLPKFSFMRYVTERPTEGVSANTVTEAGGGGILHFLVLYNTPEGLISKAQASLRKKFDNDHISIRGPVVFDKGNYALISSVLNPADGSPERKLLSAGEAPVLENSRIALSFDVNPTDSKILLESFKMSTPDVSLVFDLTFSGLSDSYDAELEIDWSEVQKSKSFGAGGNIYFVSADVEIGFDELRRNSAIRLTTTGSNASMEALLNTVYNKLLELMFKRVEPQQVPADQRGGLMDALQGMVGSGGRSGGSTSMFGLYASYQLKEMKTEGAAHLFFKGRSTITRNHFITFNVSNLYQKYGEDERFFKDVPLWDPAFQQREIFVGIDGEMEKEFDKMLNSVTVTIRKKHGNGNESLSDILINKETLANYKGTLSMRYLNQGDADRMEWLNYEYRTTWKFQGGGSYETDWIDENTAMVNLFTPFHRRKISLEGDMGLFEEKGVRAVSVQISYPFFKDLKQDRITLRPGDNLAEKAFEVTLPNQTEEVDYTITWIRKDQPRLTFNGTDSFGLIFIDEMPENP